MAVVYKATNIVNGHFYIGVTSKLLRKRKAQHFSEAKLGRRLRFYNAIRKYGRENFTFEALAGFADYEEAKREEARLVTELQPQYNTKQGGDGRLGFKMPADIVERLAAMKRGKPAHNRGGTHNAETRELLRQWHVDNPEFKPRLGKRRPGSGHKGHQTKLLRGTVARYWLGKPRSQETKDKIRATKRQRGSRSPSTQSWEKAA